MDPAACVARRTRSRRTEAKSAARVSQSVEGPPSELRKPAVTQPDTNEEAAEDPRTNSAAAEPHTQQPTGRRIERPGHGQPFQLLEQFECGNGLVTDNAVCLTDRVTQSLEAKLRR